MNKLRVAVLASNAGITVPGSLAKSILTSLTKKELLNKVELINHDLKQDELPTPDELKSWLSTSDVVVTDPVVFEGCADVFCNKDCHFKFLQSTFAGIELFVKAIKEQSPPTYPVARNGAFFGDHMAEYVIGQIVARERDFLRMSCDQKDHTWNSGSYYQYRRLSTLTIGIIGLGTIGKEIARRCKQFGMTIWGLTREPVPSDKRIPCVDQYKLLDELHELLGTSDYICSVLPSTSDTCGLLSGEVFKHCSPKKSVFINVGRGDVTDEASILKAIRAGWLSGAILDVLETEPLPSTSELWDLPGVTITPHVSAVAQVNEIAELVTDQISRYLSNYPLKYVIDWKKEY